jgi:hypothetical protein
MVKMGTIKSFAPEKLIMGILLSDAELLSAVMECIVKRFGTVDYISDPIDFTFTDYYSPEMGEDIIRYFVSFSQLVLPDALAGIKIETNEMEQTFLTGGNRRVNLDPGLVNLSRLILASTKNNVHRIPLSHGIYGEVTLVFMNGQFNDLFWTYPDYRSETYKKILTHIRKLYRDQLKQKGE